MEQDNYMEIYNFIKIELSENDNIATKVDRYPFRKRSEHIWRVYNWAKRLIDLNEYKKLDINSLLIAALFHDAGYAISPSSKDHAINSEIIFKRFIKEHHFPKDKEEFISYLIKNHSNKHLIENDDTPIELVLLCEADILDETGAMSILWDCMAEGGSENQSYRKTYEHIKEKTIGTMNRNPMKTKKGKQYWENKQKLVKQFINELKFDLIIED